MSGARARIACIATLAAIALPRPCLAWNRPVPHEYGRVVLDNFSRQARVDPVAFNHWSHRARFTCRLCHVDVGFAMSAGATQVSASTNRDHFHCGACHDGRTTYLGKAIFASCSTAKALDDGCRRCHAETDPRKLDTTYDAFAAKLPHDVLGLVDWERAEAERLVKPLDYLEGVSIRRKPLQMDREVSIEAKATWMTGIIFSHRKHTVWNGCEVCHPEIFPSTRSGEARYSMLQIASGESCGACHDKVAFPLGACDRCHVRPMR